MTELEWIKNSTSEKMKFALRTYGLTFSKLSDLLGIGPNAAAKLFEEGKQLDLITSRKIVFWYAILHIVGGNMNDIDARFDKYKVLEGVRHGH